VPTPRSSSLIRGWLDRSPHPVVALAVVLAFEALALAALVWKAGWDHIVHAIAVDNFAWFALCAGGQLIAYVGYTIGLRATAQVDGGVELPFPAALAVVSVGFGPFFSANPSGGFSVDYVTLRQAGMGPRRAFRRVLGLSALEYAVLAPAVAVCALLLFFDVGGSAPPSVTLPWLAVVPGAVAAAWLTSPKRVKRFDAGKDAGRLRRGFAHAVASLAVLRALVVGWRRCGWAFLGAALYWAGDMLTFWAALQTFGIRLSAAALVVAYGTGWALSRRSLPFGGPGVVELMLAFVLTWFGVPFAPAAAGVVAYRLFNFWLALLPMAIVLPFTHRVERQIASSPGRSPP
jgi:uncharacterized membrane protein YbhN (UPF0104 family)